MNRQWLRVRFAQVGEALREPEAFTLRWHRDGTAYDALVFVALGLTAVAGTTLYCFVMGLSVGPREVLLAGLRCSAAAGLAWGLPLPALYILNSVAGSRLRASTTFLAALVTTSWGGLAMLAGLPLAWFFTVALPHPPVVLAVHLVVFAAVGVAMVDVFGRVMAALEPERGRRPAWWLALVGAIGVELFHAFGLFAPLLP
jgi:hypothetical protein